VTARIKNRYDGKTKAKKEERGEVVRQAESDRGVDTPHGLISSGIEVSMIEEFILADTENCVLGGGIAASDRFDTNPIFLLNQAIARRSLNASNNPFSGFIKRDDPNTPIIPDTPGFGLAKTVFPVT
jgi:hypothetical protein